MDTTQQNQIEDPNATPVDMTPEEMAADLTQLMSTLNDKMNTFNGLKEESTSQLKQSQDEAIGMLFSILQDNGIDPSDNAAVSQFLERLKVENPEGYQMLENTINSLINQQGIGDQMQPPDNFAEPLNPMDQLGQEPQSPASINETVAPVEGIPTSSMPIPNPIPQSMSQPNAQEPRG